MDIPANAKIEVIMADVTGEISSAEFDHATKWRQQHTNITGMDELIDILLALYAKESTAKKDGAFLDLLYAFHLGHPHTLTIEPLSACQHPTCNAAMVALGLKP